MDFLQLINRARVECGGTGSSTPLSSAQNLTGESARFANWINAAWVDVQNAHEDWEFMRSPLQFNTVAQQQIYTPTEAGVGASFANWKRDSFRASTLGEDFRDEQLLNFMEYGTFRNLYQYANMRTTYSRPVVVTSTPAKSLGFGATPDREYVISGEYYRAASELAADTDVPAIPERFHMLLVYRAMMSYGAFEAASEVYQRGEQEFRRMMNRLEIDQLPMIVSGPPLA